MSLPPAATNLHNVQVSTCIDPVEKLEPLFGEVAMTRTLAVCALLVATSLLPGCIAIDGGHTEKNATAGQQLIDLKAALDKGAITQAEYDTKKSQILAGR